MNVFKKRSEMNVECHQADSITGLDVGSFMELFNQNNLKDQRVRDGAVFWSCIIGSKLQVP